eukprot:6730514-Prymnesium_polylepis.1
MGPAGRGVAFSTTRRCSTSTICASGRACRAMVSVAGRAHTPQCGMLCAAARTPASDWFRSPRSAHAPCVS